MRQAKVLTDLPAGTPIEIESMYKVKPYRGLSLGASTWNDSLGVWILFTDGSEIFYYEQEIKAEGIMIVECS